MGDQREKPSFQISDRRFWVEDEDVIDKAQEPGQRYPSFVEELKSRTELAESRLRQKIADLEKENEAYRQRQRKAFERRNRQQQLEMVRDLLEVADNLERALSADDQDDSKALAEGVRLNLELFLSKLQHRGIEPLSLEGELFDPHQAEAVGMVEVDDPASDQVVVETLQRGYRWDGELVRPARVRVGRFNPA